MPPQKPPLVPPAPMPQGLEPEVPPVPMPNEMTPGMLAAAAASATPGLLAKPRQQRTADAEATMQPMEA
jgi:hypothetical protein